MARSYRPVMRDQEFLLPPNMADWLPADHLVWFVIDVVDQVDTVAFHAGRKTGRQGRRGYDPDMLLALLLYAYAVGERSSRRIERLCVDHVAFRVVCGQDGPDHSTIARFRGERQAAFIDLFAQVLRLCADAGMVKVGSIAIDGTKIAANASRSATRSGDWVRERARRMAEDIVDQAARTDAAENAQSAAAGGGPGDGLPPGLANRPGRRANIAKALAELERRDAEHAKADAKDRERAEHFIAEVRAGAVRPGRTPAGVDPVALQEARIHRMRTVLAGLQGVSGKTANGRRSSLTRQIRKAEQKLVSARVQTAAGQVDRRGPGQRARDTRADRAGKRGADRDELVNLTDPDSRLMTEGSGGGSVQGYNAQAAVTDDHLILSFHVSQDANDFHCYQPTLDQASAQADALGKDIGLVLADNGYFTNDNLTSTGPDRLIAAGKNHDVHTDARTNPAAGPPPPGLSPTEAMRHRIRQPENSKRYKRRSATIEPVFGHLKDQIRLRRFARRGLPAVTAELALAATVINLTRLHNTPHTT